MDLHPSPRRLFALALLPAVAVLIAASPAGAAPVGPSTPPTRSPAPATDAALTTPSAVEPQAARAMASQRGITVAAATKRLREQHALGVRGDDLERGLQGRSGGSFLDGDGQLVVTTMDPAGDAAVHRSGATARRVDDSAARMDRIVEELDRYARESGAGGIQGWYVDVPNNSVVVTVTDGATDPRTAAMITAAASFGTTVRFEGAPAEAGPQSTAEYLAGGSQFITSSNGYCSVGFNTRDSSNRNVVLTAGHCTKAAGSNSRNNLLIGANRTADFPGDDFGTFWNSYPSYWLPQPWVDKYNGTYVRLAGQWDNPPVGATVCKSGRTTGYTCGTIRALNQTVTYPQGLIYGLVRHDACVEGGDSGGANISAGAYALGVTSGASLPKSGAFAGKCLAKQGQQNVSWYQPVGEALTRNGLKLVL